MKKKAEMLQQINLLRKNVLNLLEENKIEDAKKASEELDALMGEYEKMPEDKIAGGTKIMDKKDKIQEIKKALNAFLHKGWKGLDEADRQILKPINATDTPGQVETVGNRGGFLVPVETADFVGRMETGVYRLRTRVDEYFATTLSGNIPLASNPTAGLVALHDEFPNGGITKGQITFGNVAWQVKDYGLIVPVSNDLMADANSDVMGVIAEQFARAQVITEDTMILGAIDAAVTAKPITGWADILKGINETAPVGGVDKVIVTNTDGYNYLDTLVDDNKRPILTQALVDDPRRIFRGYEVIQLPNAILGTDATAGIPFYVGSLRDAVYFIVRKGMEISYNPYSDSAYSKNATDVRVTCRLDCKTKFADAVQKLTLAE